MTVTPNPHREAGDEVERLRDILDTERYKVAIAGGAT
jgi:hypothetical protein